MKKWKVKTIKLKGNLKLDCGTTLNRLKFHFADSGGNLPIMLAFHGLSGDPNLPTWWIKFNWKYITTKYRVLCINALGSCYGGTGPHYYYVNEKKGKPINFPKITISDMNRFLMLSLKEITSSSVDTVFGCSLGGQQVLDLYLTQPNLAKKFISVAGSPLDMFMRTYNNGIISLIETAILNKRQINQKIALKYARYLFRVSCTTDPALRVLEKNTFQNKIGLPKVKSAFSYLIWDGENYDFSIYSFLAIISAISNFKIDLKSYNTKISKNSKLTLIGISGDIFTPTSEILNLFAHLKKKGSNIEYVEFDTIYGHESWILDGKMFYKCIRNHL